MAKYEVTGLLWSLTQERYIQPGEVIEIDDETARLLFEKNVIKPAEMKEGIDGTND